jgi:hypothetical protein
MSETSCHGMLFDYPEQDLTGAVGRPLPGHAVKLVDDEGNESHLEGPGELCMRGPSMFSGYFDGSRLIKNDFDEEGYFHTGDLARRDNRTGLWYIVGRKKDLIKVRGWQVSPAEIENTLFTHPGVADAAVVGLRASDGSELPFAYIVVRAGATVTAGDIQMHVAQRLAKYKWLEAGVSSSRHILEQANNNRCHSSNPFPEMSTQRCRRMCSEIGRGSAKTQVNCESRAIAVKQCGHGACQTTHATQTPAFNEKQDMIDTTSLIDTRSMKRPMTTKRRP